MSLFSRHVELYEFGRGTQRWLYTTGDRAETYNSQVFSPVAIKRGRLTQSAEQVRANMDLTVPLSLPLLQAFRPFPPSEAITLRHLRVRISDGAVRSRWNGVISSVTERQADAQIVCQTNAASDVANGLRRCWQVSCPFALGDRDCGVPMQNYRVDAPLFSVSSASVSAAAFGERPDGWYSGGWIQWKRGAANEYRFVTRHVGTVLTLLTPATLAAGDVVSAFPGCDHSMSMCHGKFNNAPNYGGQHVMAKKNPFGGDPIF